MGVIIPTEAIVTECEGCDDCGDAQDGQRKSVHDAFGRSPLRPGARHGVRFCCDAVAMSFGQRKSRPVLLCSIVDECGMNCGPTFSRPVAGRAVSCKRDQNSYFDAAAKSSAT